MGHVEKRVLQEVQDRQCNTRLLLQSLPHTLQHPWLVGCCHAVAWPSADLACIHAHTTHTEQLQASPSQLLPMSRCACTITAASHSVNGSKCGCFTSGRR